MADRIGQRRLDSFDLAQRGGVEMADARIPQQFQRVGMRIGFRGIARVVRIAGESHSVDQDLRSRAQR